MTTYERYTIQILVTMGDKGISLRHLVRSVYNLSRTFFFTPDYDLVYRQIQIFLSRNSKSPSSIVERMPTKGYYRINKNSTAAKQLMLEFGECEEKS